jgi:hypothetical protein
MVMNFTTNPTSMLKSMWMKHGHETLKKCINLIKFHSNTNLHDENVVKGHNGQESGIHIDRDLI